MCLNSGVDKKIELKIIAEAIQKKNFEPDYTLDNPWKDNIPAESVNNLYNIFDYSKVSINYENNTDKDIEVQNSFMKKMKSSMPGDSYVETIKIKNYDKENAKYYMLIGTNDMNIKNIELLKNIKLTIKNQKGNIIYDGSLLSDGKILIGKYNINESDKLDFTISFPTSLGNGFENLNPDMFIIFSAEYDNKDAENGSIKTGDKIDYAMMTFFVSSICLITVCVLYYKEKNK